MKSAMINISCFFVFNFYSFVHKKQDLIDIKIGFIMLIFMFISVYFLKYLFQILNSNYIGNKILFLYVISSVIICSYINKEFSVPLLSIFATVLFGVVCRPMVDSKAEKICSSTNRAE